MARADGAARHTRYRDRLARGLDRRCGDFWQPAIYVPAMLCTIGILSLPIDAQTHALALDFGHSRTNWLVWMTGWARTRAVDLAVASILVLLLYAIMRRSSRWWWLAVWIGFLANTTLAGYLRVRTFEITAKRLEPIGWRYPEVVADMESVARNAGAIIPPERLVELTIPSGLGRPGYQPEFAAATPIGTLQRVIFAEQLIDDTSRPQLLFVFGHEMGHLVLHHDLKNRLIDAIILLALAYLEAFVRAGGCWCGVGRARDGASPAMSDLASLLPLLLFMLVALNFAKLPAFNATSRYFEHEADRYGLEAIHGIVPDPGAAAAGVFELCAQKCGPDAPSLDGLMGFWFREHPTEVERTRFATTYDPWSHGRQPRYVRPALEDRCRDWCLSERRSLRGTRAMSATTRRPGDDGRARVARSGYLLAQSIVVLCVGCGYGFGNREFTDARSAAIAFAKALQVQDTARMRQLSWGTVRSGLPVILREMPEAYTQFARPTPQVVTIHGGGIYGGYNEFLIVSRDHSESCRGGIRLLILTDKDASRVASIRLVPALDSVSDDACRKQINGAS